MIVVSRAASAGDHWAPVDSSLQSLAGGLDVRFWSQSGGKATSAEFERFREFAAAEICREKPDVVVVTMSPFALSEIASRCNDYGIPCVLDLRDPWALDAWPGYRSWIHWKREMGRMKRALEASAGFVANTEEARKAIVRWFPSLAAHPHAVVENGWARSDFEHVDECMATAGPSNEFGILHMGTFHAGNGARRSARQVLAGWLRYEPQRIMRLGRSPSVLLDAICSVKKATGLRPFCRFLGVAAIDSQVMAKAEANDIRVEVAGYQPHDEAVRQLRAADALFLPLGGLDVGERSLIVPGKTYEYLVAGPPIVAALPEGDARDLAARSDRAFLCDPCNAESIATAVIGAASWWRSGAAKRPRVIPNFLWDYERANLAARFREFLREVCLGGGW